MNQHLVSAVSYSSRRAGYVLYQSADYPAKPLQVSQTELLSNTQAELRKHIQANEDRPKLH